MVKLSRRALFARTAEKVTRIAVSWALVFGTRDAVWSLLYRASTSASLPAWLRGLLSSLASRW